MLASKDSIALTESVSENVKSKRIVLALNLENTKLESMDIDKLVYHTDELY